MFDSSDTQSIQRLVELTQTVIDASREQCCVQLWGLYRQRQDLALNRLSRGKRDAQQADKVNACPPHQNSRGFSAETS